MQVKDYKLEYDHPLYDTMQLTAAANQSYEFFSIPKGGALTAAANKDWQHTNLIQAAQLESGRAMLVTGMSICPRESASGGARPTLADLLTFHNTSHVHIEVNQSSFGRYPVMHIPSGGGELMYFSNITPAATEFHVNRGVSAMQNRYVFTQPILIEPHEPLRVTLTVTGTIVAVTDVTFTFWGEQTRPVG
ncbi:MAG: hypothetical protein ACYTBJ_06790 [Planctomycetota bacterium]|jgi:hypothetical protein